jgi:hypothetical protein
MADAPYFLIPLREVFSEDQWPGDVLAQTGEEGNAFDLVYRAELVVEGGSGYLAIDGVFVVVRELVLPLLPADAIALVLGSGSGDERGRVSLSFTLGTRPETREDEDSLTAMEEAGAAELGAPPPSNPFEEEQPETDDSEPTAAAAPLPWRAEIVVDALNLRFSRELLLPVTIDPDTHGVTTKEGHVTIGVPLGFRANSEGQFVFGIGAPPAESTGDDGSEITPPPVVVHLSDSFQIGTSRVTVTVGDIYLRFSPETPPPSWAPADQGPGVYLQELSLILPPDMSLGILEEVGARDVVIATGGFSGILEATWTQRLLDPAEGEPPRFEAGPGAGELFGMPFALRTLDFEIRQNSFARAGFHCDIIPPVIEKPLGMLLSIDADGKFAAEVRASDLLDEDADDSLVHLRQDGLLDLTVSAARFELADDVGTFSLAGKLKPLVGGLDWPTLDVEKLSINTRGEVDLDGGWVDVPETFSLDFHAFKIELSRVGFGTEGEGEARRNWVGLSGGIKLLEGVPLSASVSGLKVSWLPPPAPDPQVQVSLEGVALSFEIPNTLKLEGAMSYRELPKPPATLPAGEEPPAPGEGSLYYGHTFSGSINLEITCLNMAIAGELMIGDLTSYHWDGRTRIDDQRFTALFILLNVELPTAIPLGATGAGLYGVKGLFGLNVAPDRHLDEENEPEAWYSWYKADRGQSSAHSVAKVVKWAPRPDNHAFGAGLKLGTVYDDGFTINAGVLAAILIPGPVVMIEGRANLLKQRTGDGEGMEGALYTLIVFDGLAETFQMNVDVNLAIEDVITVAGGMEAFFDFNDSSRWYIHIGTKEPLDGSKRIRADILSIITAKAYFMIEPTGIQFGAAVGVDLEYTYGPIELKLIIRLSFDVGVFWKQPQITGDVDLYIELSIKVFGIGLGLLLECGLDASAPQPWWIHGIAHAALTLPFPLPSFDVQVEFTWGQTGEPAVVDLLGSATMIHPKLTGASWALPGATVAAGEAIAAAVRRLPARNEWPLVPVDSIPSLSLGKALSGISLTRDAEGNPIVFHEEKTENVYFGYQLRDVELFVESSSGTWETVMPRSTPDASELRLRPDPYAMEPQAELWWYSPLDTYDPQSRRNYENPCLAPAPADRHCVNWRDVTTGTQYPAIFSRGGLAFTTDIRQRGIVEGIAPTTPDEPDRGLAIRAATIRFPEPVSLVELHVSGTLTARAYRSGSEAHTTMTSAAGVITIEASAGIDVLRVVATGALDLSNLPVIREICWTTLGDSTAAAARGSSPPRTDMRSTLVLEPNRSYALRATGVRTERDEGETATTEASQSMVWAFHTGGLPGTDYANDAVVTPAPCDFADGPLNNVETYVARTVPQHGAPLFYRGYDVLVELADPYTANMLAPVLSMRIRDRNGKQLTPAPRLSVMTGDLPFSTLGLQIMLSASHEEGCEDEHVPWTPQVLGRYIAGTLPDDTRPGKMIRVELVAVFPYGEQSVFEFELATSRFLDATAHLSSAQTRPPRALGHAAAPPLDWIPDLQERVAARAALRDTLAAACTVGPQDAGMTIDEARAAIATATAELAALSTGIFELLDRGETLTLARTSGASPVLSYAGIHDLFVAVGLGHRPLPPRAIESLEIETPAGNFFLLESPEPLDWTRITVRRASDNVTVPVVWSSDGTRAFIFDATSTHLFGDGARSLIVSYLRGGPTAPDLDPLYRGGTLSALAEEVTWDLS